MSLGKNHACWYPWYLMLSKTVQGWDVEQTNRIPYKMSYCFTVRQFSVGANASIGCPSLPGFPPLLLPQSEAVSLPDSHCRISSHGMITPKEYGPTAQEAVAGGSRVEDQCAT